MINDQEFLHGAAFLRLVDHGEQITITHASWIHPSIYLVDTGNSQSAILFKISKKPKSAWSFTLSSQEESALNILPNKYDEISLFLVLICHKDGICCIPQKRLWSVLDTETGIAGQHISVSRKPHGSYHVSGPGRQKMEQTVPQNDWPRVLFLNRIIPMTKIDITTNGYCIDKLIERVKSKIGDTAGEQLKQTAVEVVQNCVDVYSNTFGFGDVGAIGTGIVSRSHKGKIADGTTGLIYGKVQSGKTNTTIATLALAHANDFRCFIVLTSDNTWLGKQTADRFVNQLEGGPVVFNWEQWRNDPEDFATNQLLDYIQDTGVLTG